MAVMRLDKYLANMGCGSRSQVKEMIKKGMVLRNGQAITEPEAKINTEEDEIVVDGKKLTYKRYEYYMLNKPAGYVSAVTDEHFPTVCDLTRKISKRKLFPVGRLDKDTEGLLLLTDDGELAHRLLAPGKHVDKVYLARVDKEVMPEDIEAFAKGLDIGEKRKTLPAKLEIIKSGQPSEVKITIQEGKFHQIKRMFHAVNKEVLYLKRISMGTLLLDDTLKKGECRQLTEMERKQLTD